MGILWGFSQVFMWVWNGYEDWNPVPRQPCWLITTKSQYRCTICIVDTTSSSHTYTHTIQRLGMSEKRGSFFSKYVDHVIAKYAVKICGNRPRLHIRVNLTWYIFGDGIAQSLFSKFTAYQSLESTCIGLIGRKLCFSDMPIQLAATNRLHHHPPCSLNNDYWLSVNQITTNNIYCRRKCQNMRKKICDMRTLLKYAKNAAKCQICGNRIFPFFWHA